MISTVQDLAAEALFVSDVQPSDEPSCTVVQDAVTATILRLGSDGCAAAVATEFGDHPDAAVCRMSWARRQVARIAPLALDSRRALLAYCRAAAAPSLSGAGAARRAVRQTSDPHGSEASHRFTPE